MSLLQRLQGQDFCSPEHKTEFQREQEEMALARLQQTATNLKRPEVRSTSKSGLKAISSPSNSSIELRRETEPPMGGFLDDWRSTAVVPPLPPELKEEALTVQAKVPAVKQFPVSPAAGVCYTQMPLAVKTLCGDMITILSPRTSSIVATPAPAIPTGAAVSPFPWAAQAMILEEGPPEATLVQLTTLRARVHEPAVKGLDPHDTGFTDVRLRVPNPGGWCSPEPRMNVRTVSLSGLSRCREWVSGTREANLESESAVLGLPALEGHDGRRAPATRLAPDLAGTVTARVRFGYRRPRRHRIQAVGVEISAAPVIVNGVRSILSPMLAWPAGSIRRLRADAAKAAAKPLPHFAAIPVPVSPRGYDYAPDLNPIAITANWLAATVPIPVTMAEAARVSAPSPFQQAEFGPTAPSSGQAWLRLDQTACEWATPPLAPRVGLEWRASVNTALVPAIGGGHEDFAPIPRLAARTTSMRAAVPPTRRRIKMEVRLEPPKPAPWFEPLTCAFGGDPYGSR